MAEQPRSNEVDFTKDLHPDFIKRCVCPLALLMLLATVLIVVILTIFHVKHPIVQINSVGVAKLNPISNTTLIADVSIKNPNFASFEYSNTTTTLYYHGIMVGEARGPPRRAKARHTIRMTVTMNVITQRIICSPYFKKDLRSGVFITIGRFSGVPGKVKILNLFKKHVVVTTNSTTTFRIFTQVFKEQICKWKLKL
ncbi:Late embryogenesis abundant protein [Sesbania bispinosa]|nr:Late embryogenesis abundant protein [Sesbania bispinosa]